MNKQIILTGFADEIDKDIRTQLDGIKQLGMHYFDPRNVNGKQISLLTESETEMLAAEMDKRDIKVGSIGSRIGKISIEDDFGVHMEELANTIRVAKRLGTKYIRIFSFRIPQGERPEVYREAVMDRMNSMVRLALEEGIILLHENEKGIYGDTADRCLDVLKTVKSPALGCIFDPANFVQCGEDCKVAFEKLSPYITYLHIKDAVEDGMVVPAGTGLGAVPEMMEKLLAKGFSGFACLEPHLGRFEGLAELELSDEMMQLNQSDFGKFKIAHDAFCAILEKVGA